MNGLEQQLTLELQRPVLPAVSAFAQSLTRPGTVAVLFYGSALRASNLEGLLDFYVLVDDLRTWHGSVVAGTANAWLPPNVSYEERVIEGQTLRAKVAVLSLAQFRRGMRVSAVDTTLWARFAQPVACVWSRDEAAQQDVRGAIADAVSTAAHWAAVLGPEQGEALTYWEALFRRTYAAELRVESGARSQSIIGFDGPRYTALLPVAWERAGITFARESELLKPQFTITSKRDGLAAWNHRQRLGKPLNLARLVKAAFTFKGGADYLAWKIERHSGVKLELSDWQRRHPILAAPGLAWKLKKRGVI